MAARRPGGNCSPYELFLVLALEFRRERACSLRQLPREKLFSIESTQF